MAQHFLLSAAARTLSLSAVARMSDEEVHATFQAIRWADNDGEPYCPRCGCLDICKLATQPRWKCRGCAYKFSVTSQTIFADRKRSLRDYLLAIAIFTNGAKGHSALQLSRDLNCQYKTAFVLSHKLREAIDTEQRKTKFSVDTVKEVDGAYFGDKVRQHNEAAKRVDRRLPEVHSGNRQVVVVMRERNGRTLPFVFRKESDAVHAIRRYIPAGSVVHADEARGWDQLHAHYDMHRINHSVAFSKDDACTNQAESFFSRLRRAEMGQHHRISGTYLDLYASEMAWREDRRRTSNGAQHVAIAGAALSHPHSLDFRRYWQRSARR